MKTAVIVLGAISIFLGGWLYMAYDRNGKLDVLEASLADSKAAEQRAEAESPGMPLRKKHWDAMIKFLEKRKQYDEPIKAKYPRASEPGEAGMGDWVKFRAEILPLDKAHDNIEPEYPLLTGDPTVDLWIEASDRTTRKIKQIGERLDIKIPGVAFLVTLFLFGITFISWQIQASRTRVSAALDESSDLKKWLVEGHDIETGVETSIVVMAESPTSAASQGRKKNMKVLKVKAQA